MFTPRLTLSIALALLPRWARHDFWRQSQPANDRAKQAIVAQLIEPVNADFHLAERNDNEYRGWDHGGAKERGGG